MFWSADTQTADEHLPLGDRVRDALALARAFLTLEDDYDVDWDFGPLEPEQTPSVEAVDEAFARPRRRPASGGRTKRRGGAPVPVRQVCLSPLPPRVEACRQATRARQGPAAPAEGPGPRSAASD